MDGTLLDSKQQVSKENLEAIKEFKKNGGLFTIATGRMLKSALPFIDQLEIDIPVILYNGAIVYNPNSKENILTKMLVNQEILIDIIKPYQTMGEIGLLVYQNDEVYALEQNRIVKEYENKEKVQCEILTKKQLEGPIIKVLVISNNPQLLKQCNDALFKANYPCETVYSEHNYLEILPKTASKGAALKTTIQSYFQHVNLTTICVGDNLNDISMLEVATKGFFVENSNSFLKRGEFQSTVHHEDHAIADIIYNYILATEM